MSSTRKGSTMSITTTPRRRLAVATVAGTLLAGTLLVAGPAQADDEPAPDAGSSATAPSDADRDRLHEAVDAARELDGDERREALDEIREDALAGEYGDAIQERFERRAERRAGREGGERPCDDAGERPERGDRPERSDRAEDAEPDAS
ncbi:hypothetical protein [Aeromicrobium marinum]|uniref:hypothetical protein n=1 Tax=Aeromicrobium marinum TaxID=219314 RepID=UPI0012EABC9A|nr:hypothetical protein [Aeromicrobium marinum]